MKWTIEDFSEVKLEAFRVLALVFALLVTLDQTQFWSWTLDGAFTTISLLSFLPLSFLESLMAFHVISVFTGIALLLWMFRVRPRITSITSVFLFTLATTFYLQNLPFADHRQSVLFFILAALAAYEFGTSKKTVLALSAFALLSIYVLAGWEKIAFSGISWVNGTSLQIFVQHLGRTQSYLRTLLLQSYELAFICQFLILGLECFAFLVFLKGPIRWLFLIGLLGFHVGLEEIFAYRFFPLYILLFYLFGWSDLKKRFSHE